MNRIKSKDYSKRTYKVNKINKIYIQNNGYDKLALGY